MFYFCSMGTNTFGRLFNVSTFGESHGTHVGVVVDGCPAGLRLDFEKIQVELNRRKPQPKYSTERIEADLFEIISGINDTITTGAPICILIKNTDANAKEYVASKEKFRPNHADYTYFKKYGNYSQSGGGRSSARVTAGWVAAGAIAKQLLTSTHSITFLAEIDSIGAIKTDSKNCNYTTPIIEGIACYDAAALLKMQALLDDLKTKGDTTGGVVRCAIENVPVAWGEPLGYKLQAALAHAMMSINAAHAFEYGSGMSGTAMLGSEHNDAMKDGYFLSNYSGGIQGGISNGNTIAFRVGFKPISSIKIEQLTMDFNNENTKLKIEGRHDPCPVIRAIPIVEAMAAIVLADMFMFSKVSKL